MSKGLKVVANICNIYETEQKVIDDFVRNCSIIFDTF